jgi:hypothetical protein
MEPFSFHDDAVAGDKHQQRQRYRRRNPLSPADIPPTERER